MVRSLIGKNRARIRAVIRGAVQGVGFRPFVFRLAQELDLTGWVCNTSQGVLIEVEGEGENLAAFRLRIRQQLPPLASIQSLETTLLDACGYPSFEIRQSRQGSPSALILPDIATCSDCLKDILEPGNRRFGYPFTNCTNCGPRFSIILLLPYDRANTTMSRFQMCPRCQAEYDDPGNRRFHAQPNACPECGPQIQLRDLRGTIVARRREALERSIAMLQSGKILALKGLGGFHLMVDATSEDRIRALRTRKRRQEKPLAVMFARLEEAHRHCEISDLEAEILTSAEAPILLVRRRADENTICESVAPRNPMLGAMLPSTPLHHLLLRGCDRPLVATSGNLSGEPICRENDEALQRLGGIADFILEHDRPIARSIDDSVLALQGGREVMLRRARGYAPLPLPLKDPAPTVLAVGGHLKSSIALSRKRDVFVSQHVGDLDNACL